MRPKVIVFGAGGNIGIHIVRVLERKFEVTPVVHNYTPRGMVAARVDITDTAAVDGLLHEIRPDAVVNAAAVADANLCEREPALARAVNVDGAANIARACETAAARLVHYSTDLVFDGRKGLYTEADEPNPLNIYAAAKLESERVSLSLNPKTAVLRVGIVYGPGSGARKSFFESAVEKGKNGEKVKVFTDQYRSFLYVEDAAAAALSLIESSAAGLYHAGGDERLSRYDFMSRVYRSLKIPAGTLEPVAMADLTDQAPRPADCSLDSSRIKRDTGWRPTAFAEAMAAMAQLL